METYRTRCRNSQCGFVRTWIAYKTGIGKTPEQLAEMKREETTCIKCGGQADTELDDRGSIEAIGVIHGIWAIYFLHAGKELISAVVIAASEQDARQMIFERDKPDLLEPQRRNWLDDKIASCRQVGHAVEGESQGVLMFVRPRFLTERDKAQDAIWADLKRKGLVR